MLGSRKRGGIGLGSRGTRRRRQWGTSLRASKPGSLDKLLLSDGFWGEGAGVKDQNRVRCREWPKETGRSLEGINNNYGFCSKKKKGYSRSKYKRRLIPLVKRRRDTSGGKARSKKTDTPRRSP